MKILRNRENQKLVRVRTGFANCLDFEVVSMRDPRHGLTKSGLIAAFRGAHCAEGRDLNQDTQGRYIEDRRAALSIWESQYKDSALEIMSKFGVG